MSAWALAGVRGYVEATPVIGYRESGGKPGTCTAAWSLRALLGTRGDLFVEIDSPWWSPLPDKKWTGQPLGQIEYPLGEFAIGADVDYILGSKRWPEIKFSEAKVRLQQVHDRSHERQRPKGAGRRQGTARQMERGQRRAQPGPKPKGDKGKPKGKLARRSYESRPKWQRRW